MTASADDRKRVRVGWWTLPALAVGLVVGLTGFELARGAAPARSFCHLLTVFQPLLQMSSGRVVKLPACAAANRQYDIGVAAAALGAAIMLVAIVALVRRSRRAAAAGAPWPVRQPTESLARRLDAWRPGRTRHGPRLRAGYLLALGATLAIVGAGWARSAWQSYRRSAQLSTYHRATAALAALKLPASIHRKPSASCGSPVCGRSQLQPPQIEPMLRRLLHGVPDATLAELLGCPGPCPVMVYGHFDGAPALGIAFWHLVIIRHGPAPAGAVASPHGHGHVFFFGSDVHVEAIQPGSDNG